VRSQSNPQQLKQPRKSGLSCATSGIINNAFTVYYHYTHKSARPTNRSNMTHARNTRKRKHIQNTLPTSPPSSHTPTPPAILSSHSIHHITHNHPITSPRQPDTAIQTQHKHTPTNTPHSPKDDLAQHTQPQTIPFPLPSRNPAGPHAHTAFTQHHYRTVWGPAGVIDPETSGAKLLVNVCVSELSGYYCKRMRPAYQGCTCVYTCVIPCSCAHVCVLSDGPVCGFEHAGFEV
jgi:hypothetical protein